MSDQSQAFEPAVSPVKTPLPETGEKSPSISSVDYFHLAERIVRVKEGLFGLEETVKNRNILTGKPLDDIHERFDVIHSRFEDICKRFEIILHHADRHFDNINECFEMILGQLARRFEDIKKRFEDPIRRFEMMLYHSNRRFAAMIDRSNRHFDVMRRRFDVICRRSNRRFNEICGRSNRHFDNICRQSNRHFRSMVGLSIIAMCTVMGALITLYHFLSSVG